MTDKILQAVIIPKSKFTLNQAENYIKSKDLKPIKQVHETDKYWRYRMEEPRPDCQYSYETKPMDVGYIYCWEPRVEKTHKLCLILIPISKFSEQEAKDKIKSLGFKPLKEEKNKSYWVFHILPKPKLASTLVALKKEGIKYVLCKPR